MRQNREPARIGPVAQTCARKCGEMFDHRRTIHLQKEVLVGKAVAPAPLRFLFELRSRADCDQKLTPIFDRVHPGPAMLCVPVSRPIGEPGRAALRRLAARIPEQAVILGGLDVDFKHGAPSIASCEIGSPRRSSRKSAGGFPAGNARRAAPAPPARRASCESLAPSPPPP